jgi:hypothetical protein
MAFGLSSSLIFAYLPMLKMAGQPLIAYRMLPGSILRGVGRSLGVEWEDHKFSNAEAGVTAMNKALDQGKAVGAQTCIYWLPYIPDDMRFHFNAHNLVVVGRDNDTYQVSDPLFPDLRECDAPAMQKARFAKGVMAPKGRIYWPKSIPQTPNIADACVKAVKRNAKMLKAPLIPMVGVQGIELMGRKIQALEKKYGNGGELHAFLGHIVRMQEEIGTGGAGFRFIYSAFLQEAAEITGEDKFASASKDLTDAGDEWRRFALAAVKMCRGRKDMDTKALKENLYKIADMERDVWKNLRQV